MKNKDLIIKIARRLDKFNADEMIVVSELSEKEVTEILSELLSEKVIVKNNDTYYFNSEKTVTEVENNTPKPQNKDIKPIVIEEEEGYDYFLTLNETAQKNIRNQVELLNMFIQTGGKNKLKIVNFFNETTAVKKISYSGFSKLYNRYIKYGFKSCLPRYSFNITSSIPNEIYEYFKKFYLTKEKLSVEEALYRAQMQLQAEQKIEQPYTFSSAIFLRKIKKEFSKEQIKYFRNNINPPKAKNNAVKDKEPLNMLFKQAAKFYLNRLKSEKQLERLLHDKTDYNNHLKEHFDNFTIREITNQVIFEYKQNMFNRGFKLNSVTSYIALLKKIIKEFCPQTNNFLSKENKLSRSVYALDMNILPNAKIKKLLKFCRIKFSSAYPMLYISLSTGASIPELLGLTWDRLNFDEHTIFLKYFLYGNQLIMNRCGSSIRNLKINEEICSILKEKFNNLKPALTDFVFTFDTQKPVQQYFEEEILTSLAKYLKIPKLNPRDFQHNFANMCIQQNIPLTFVQKALGYHSLPNFIKIYGDLIKNTEKGNYNPLNKLKII